MWNGNNEQPFIAYIAELKPGKIPTQTDYDRVVG